jgi:23S rRNA (uridine2552-2'-O)-methyltransferase
MNRRRNLDHYARKAKAGGFAARSVFKLEEIHRKTPLMKKGDRVLDLGCAPGSWLKYAALEVGPKGHCVGIDRVSIELSMPNVETLVGDIYEIDDALLTNGGRKFNLVMSDMAPDTCGNQYTDHVRSVQLCERAFEIATKYLKPHGRFVCKVFEGGDLNAFVSEVKLRFKTVKRVKPKSTRSESVELFIVGLDYKGDAE